HDDRDVSRALLGPKAQEGDRVLGLGGGQVIRHGSGLVLGTARVAVKHSPEGSPNGPARPRRSRPARRPARPRTRRSGGPRPAGPTRIARRRSPPASPASPRRPAGNAPGLPGARGSREPDGRTHPR